MTIIVSPSVVRLVTAQETVFDVVVSRFTLRWHNVTVQEPRREYQPLCFIDRLDNLDIHYHGLYRFNLILRYQPCCCTHATSRIHPLSQAIILHLATLPALQLSNQLALLFRS